MKRAYVVFLAVAASLGLGLMLFSVVAGHSAPTLAAPQSFDALIGVSWEGCAPSYQTQITCTLATTTTDSLENAGTYNDDHTSAAMLANYTGLALAPGDKAESVPPKDDWFRLDNAKLGWTYQVKAYPDKTNNYNLGIIVYKANLTPIITDTTTNNNYAEITLVADSYGPYFFKVFQISQQCSGETYHLDFSSAAPTPTPTATSTPTPTPTSTPVPGATAIPGADQLEPNYDFDHAATIGTDITYEANFIPWGGGGEDNDFYKIWIKPGLHFTCETLDLAPGVDTNMIVFDGPSWDNAVGGNDDVELGDYRSRFSYFSTYEGWLYILVGHGGRLPASELEDSDYKVRCEKQVPGQPTATSIPESTRTPQPTAPPGSATVTPTTSGSPIATPAPSEGLTVRTLTTPTPVPATTPAPRFVPISLLVYYDANDDHQPGAGEGIAGVSAQAYEAVTNQLLAQGFTDEQGSLEFTVAAQGPVRVSVPFFGFSQLVAGEGASIYVRVPPQPLPGGAP